jgi:hypothetical protein
MTVDLRLNALIRALDERLKTVSIDDVELSVRTLKALKDCGVRTLHEAQMALINRQLHRQHGIGPKAVREVEEIIFNVTAELPPPAEMARQQRRLELNSLLLAYESHVLALYTYQRADETSDQFKDIDIPKSTAERKLSLENVRRKILAFADAE